MKFDEIVQSYDVDYTKNVISKEQINDIESALDVNIGDELKEYILTYGYLGYSYIELYGIYSNMMLESDMVTQTKYLHKYFEKTIGYIALENTGEGDYAIVDSNDRVYLYDSELDQLTDLEETLTEYISKRFEEAE